ncbi:MAG: ATP-binding protein, partial [Phormidesmis sp. CAN_BIN36]|nr:ATP-binding protein [Phormidesmis sp. CAN_BIN36]
DLGRLTNRFGVDPKVLPMVPVRLRQGEECAEGLALLRQMVLARAFPTMPPAKRLQLISMIFDHPETLDRLCRVSGGHVRNLLMLLYRCLQRQDPPISSECLESIIRQRRGELALAITENEWELLRQVIQQKNVRGEDGYQTLLRSMFVFEYRDEESCWFDLNPILAESKELQL